VGFLDNLENTLKALERQEERDPEAVKRAQAQREADRNAALGRAPHVQALRDSQFTSDLLGHCRVVGREQRVLVQFTWIGDNLRLDAKSKRLELIPEADGIHAVYSENGSELRRAIIDFTKEDPAALARTWLTA
jgi:hypothetical protein